MNSKAVQKLNRMRISCSVVESFILMLLCAGFTAFGYNRLHRLLLELTVVLAVKIVTENQRGRMSTTVRVHQPDVLEHHRTFAPRTEMSLIHAIWTGFNHNHHPLRWFIHRVYHLSAYTKANAPNRIKSEYTSHLVISVPPALP
jgi:hypothetical protein